MEIMIARQEDIEDISQVLATSWKSAYRGIIEDTFLDNLRQDNWVQKLRSGFNKNGGFCMVLREEGQIVGAAILTVAETETEIHLTALYLLPERIGKGYGSILYSAVEAEIIKRGYSECSLAVLQANDRAIGFYKSRQFEDINQSLTVTLGSSQYTCLTLKKTLQ